MSDLSEETSEEPATFCWEVPMEGVDVRTPRSLADYQAAYALYRGRYIRAVVWLQDIAEAVSKDPLYSDLEELVLRAFEGLRD